MKEKTIQFFTEYDCYSRIRKAYPQPAHTVLSTLRDGTGFITRGQSADAVAFGTWPSRGLKIIGFEIKSYRGDWLRELKQPAKAETFACYCDEWWIVAAEDVVKIEEVPDVWGWATPTEKGLKRLKEPKQIKPKEIDRVFLMSIMRNVGANYTPTKEVKETIQQQVEQEIERRRDSGLLDLKYANEKVGELKKQIVDFETAAGFEISTWRCDPATVGAVVKELTTGDMVFNLQKMESAGKAIQQVLEDVRSLPFFKKEN